MNRRLVFAMLVLGAPLETSARAASETDASMSLALRVASGDVVAWDSSAKTVVFRGCWLQEGTGEGCSISIKALAGKPPPEISMWEPGDVEDKAAMQARIAAAAQKLADRLRKGMFVAIEASPWPKGKDKAVLGDVRLTWSKFRLSVSGTSIRRASRAVKHMREWKPSPIRFFYGPGLVVVEIEHDPGEAYSTDGLNVNHTFEPIPLLPSKTRE
jgi:hypothetical protein